MDVDRISSSEITPVIKGVARIVDELADGQGGYARGPERSLLSALLFDGIQAYIQFALAQSKKNKSRCAEAERWIFSEDYEGPFSFEGVCEALGIKPEYLRYGLINATSSLLAEAGRLRRNF